MLKRSRCPTVTKQLVTFSANWTTEKCIYFIAILVEGDAEVGIVGTTGTFSTYGRDHVDKVNNTTLTGQSYFRQLSRVTYEYKLPEAEMDQTLQNSAIKPHLERVFADAALTILKPTAIYIVLKFKEVLANCSTDLTSLIRSQP